MQKRNKKLYIGLLVYIGGITVVPILLMMIVSSGSRIISIFQKNEKIYYIPQIDMYIKLVHEPYKDTGYIYFNSQRHFNNMDSLDYIAIRKSGEDFTTRIYILPSTPSKFYIMDEDKSLMEEKSSLYEMEHVVYLCDTSYVYVNSKVMPVFLDCYWSDSIPIKQEHITIAIGSNFEKLLFSDINATFLETAIEIKDLD